MADTKISDLPAATLPLSGTELIALVQSGATVQATADDLPAGGGASTFDAIGGGTNTTAAMVVGTGASLATTGSGTIVATSIAARTIGGVSYDGTANITVASATGGFAVSGGNLTVAGAEIITSTGAQALAVGANGATNPVLTVDASVASVASGVTIKGNAAASGAQVIATSSGSNESLNLDSKGTSAVNLRVGGNTAITAGNTQCSFTTISRSSTTNSAFLFSSISGSSLTAGTEAHYLHMNFTSTQTHSSNTGITLQRDVRVSNLTHAFASATGTITDAAALAVDGAPKVGTNAAITNSSSIYSAGSAVGAGVTNSYGLNIRANSGATNNYVAKFGAGVIQQATTTVGALIAAATAGAGARSMVSDALTPVFGAAVAAGGAVVVPVYSDGTNWIVG